MGSLLVLFRSLPTYRCFGRRDFRTSSPGRSCRTTCRGGGWTRHPSTPPSLVANLTAISNKHCKFCSKEFKNAVSCKKHEDELHVVKLVTCSTCQKECLSPLALRNHMKSHKLQSCTNCSKTFNMNNFTRHLKTCLGSNSMKPVKTTNKSKRLKAQKLRNNKTSECPTCFEEFTWIQSLKRHQKLCAATKIDKEFKCPLCPKSYSWKHTLKKHLFDLHWIQYSQ